MFSFTGHAVQQLAHLEYTPWILVETVLNDYTFCLVSVTGVSVMLQVSASPWTTEASKRERWWSGALN